MAGSAVCDRHPWHVRAKPTGDGADEPLGEEPEVAPLARSFGGGALSGPGGARLEDVEKLVRRTRRHLVGSDKRPRGGIASGWWRPM
jgi:hypothetical protein